jgi:transposase
MMGLGVETMTRKRRKFTDEFKTETVRLVNEGPRSLAEVARDLDLTESAVRNWVARADVDTGRREGITTSELEELRRLRAGNRQLRMEREILKKATAFFAKEST